MSYVLSVLLLSSATEWAHEPYMILNPLIEIFLNPAVTTEIPSGRPPPSVATIAGRRSDDVIRTSLLFGLSQKSQQVQGYSRT